MNDFGRPAILQPNLCRAESPPRRTPTGPRTGCTTRPSRRMSGRRKETKTSPQPPPRTLAEIDEDENDDVNDFNESYESNEIFSHSKICNKNLSYLHCNIRGYISKKHTFENMALIILIYYYKITIIEV